MRFFAAALGLRIDVQARSPDLAAPTFSSPDRAVAKWKAQAGPELNADGVIKLSLT